MTSTVGSATSGISTKIFNRWVDVSIIIYNHAYFANCFWASYLSEGSDCFVYVFSMISCLGLKEALVLNNDPSWCPMKIFWHDSSNQLSYVLGDNGLSILPAFERYHYRASTRNISHWLNPLNLKLAIISKLNFKVVYKYTTQKATLNTML